MWRDDPVEEPWYELDFQMTRWQCPNGLPEALLDDVIEAVRELDHITFKTLLLVNRFTYGLETAKKRYIPEFAYELFRGEFELAEDRFLAAQNALRVRWASMMASHRSLIEKLPEAIRESLGNPEASYSIKHSVFSVDLDEKLKQFLTGIHPCKERDLFSA